MIADPAPSSSMPVARSYLWALAGIAISLPAALGLEALIGHLLLPPSVTELRLILAPFLTPVAWALALVALPTDLGALALHRWLWARAVARAADPSEVGWKRFEALMISASVAQLPALAAVFLHMMGAGLVPVMASLAVSTMGVVVLGVAVR